MKEFSSLCVCIWNALQNDSTFVTCVVMLNKENVNLFLNYRWHIHSVTPNLITILQSVCPKQLCLMRKGCLCCVLLYYKCNSSHKIIYVGLFWDLCLSFVLLSMSYSHLLLQHDVRLHLRLYRKRFKKSIYICYRSWQVFCWKTGNLTIKSTCIWICYVSWHMQRKKSKTLGTVVTGYHFLCSKNTVHPTSL